MGDWIDVVVVSIHNNKITQSELAEKYGCKREFINRLLNRAINPPKDAEERVMGAIEAILAERASKQAVEA